MADLLGQEERARMGKNGFPSEDPITTNLRVAADNRGAIYVAGRTPITDLHMGGRDLWMTFLVVENLDDSDQFILGRDFAGISL